MIYQMINKIKETSGSLLIRFQNFKDVTLLLIVTIIFKITLEVGYWILVSKDHNTYIADFSILKYLVGTAWCAMLFFGISHQEKKVSSFFLYFIYLTQIIPITIIYALGNQDSIYYNVVCIAFFVCENIVGINRKKETFRPRNKTISTLMMICFFSAVVILIISIFIENGFPTLAAMDIYDVYAVRDNFQLNKYMNYILSMVTAAVIPILITKYIIEKRYIFATFFVAVQLVLYLYTGNKAWLFMLPLVIITVLWSRRENFYKEFFICFCLGMSALTLLACFSPFMEDFWNNIFSLLGRRTMLLPANNKFVYYDYFSNNPPLGLGGIFPRWLVDIPSFYENVPYTYEISDIYFGKPDMQSNTGFLAEGFARFGHVGTLIILIFFAFILRKIDGFQKREGYSLTIGFFIYAMYTLIDRFLLDSFIMGPWMVLACILIFYTKVTKEDYISLFNCFKQKIFNGVSFLKNKISH